MAAQLRGLAALVGAVSLEVPLSDCNLSLLATVTVFLALNREPESAEIARGPLEASTGVSLILRREARRG